MRTPLLATTFLLAASLTAPASAHPYPTPHRHYYPPPPPVVVYQPPPPPPRVMHVYSPPPPPPVVVAPAPETSYAPFGIGIRVGGAALEGHKLFLSDLENPAMGGVGIALRSRLDEHFGIELAADWLGGSNEDFFQSSIPITFGVLFYLFPESRFQPYGLASIGVQFTELEYADGAFSYQLTEGIGALGLGVEIALSDHFKLNADVRFLTVFRGLGSRVEVQDACFGAGAAPSLCSGVSSFDPEDRFNLGIQFLAAANYFF